MVKPKNVSGKEEPPDRGKGPPKQSLRNIPKSPLRPAKGALAKTSSPKPLSKDKFEIFKVKALMNSQIPPSKGKTAKGQLPKGLPKTLKRIQAAGEQESKEQPTTSQIDPLENVTYIATNANTLTANSTKKRRCNRKNSKETAMDYE